MLEVVGQMRLNDVLQDAQLFQESYDFPAQYDLSNTFPGGQQDIS